MLKNQLMKVFLQLLLLCAFLGGQCAALVHASHHGLGEHRSGVCEVCSLAHAAPVPPSPPLLPQRSAPDAAPCVAAVFTALDRLRFALPHTRAPPRIAPV